MLVVMSFVSLTVCVTRKSSQRQRFDARHKRTFETVPDLRVGATSRDQLVRMF